MVRRNQTLIDFLLANPRISGHVRNVALCKSVSLQLDKHEQENFQRLLVDLTGLRYLQVQELDQSTLPVVQALCGNPQPVHVVVGHHVYGDVYDGLASGQIQCYSELPNNCSISLGLDANMSATMVDIVKRILFQRPVVHALKFRQWLSQTRQVALPPSRLDYDALLTPKGRSISGLEELHLSDLMLREQAVETGLVDLFQQIDFRRVRRLALTGNAMIEEFFPRAAEKLVHLESLWLSSTYDRSLLFAVGLAGPPQDPLTAGVTFADPQDSPILKLKRLTDLRLDCASRALTSDYIATASLRNVRLHQRETLRENKTYGGRSPEDIRRLASSAPSITHLELDIGYIGNLWHATAVPGVDVDVRIYQVLNAITHFENLTFLRLFPPYIVNHTPRVEGHTFQQPLSDEQAIRIFRHLKSGRPSLQTLSITADPVIARDALDFECMSWTVTAVGNSKTILTTRQVNKSYEQRQVWEGERRLRTEIKRFSYPKSYFPETCQWIFE